MKNKKFIKIGKLQKGRTYINRYMHLLDLIAPNKYELDTLNLLASIINKRTDLTVVLFSENPFK